MTDQPAPVPQSGPDVTDRVIEILQTRREQGISEYGHSLRLWDGRDNMQDLIEELADALQYAVKEQERRDALVAIGPLGAFEQVYGYRPVELTRSWDDEYVPFKRCWDYLMERWKGERDADDGQA